MDHSEIVHAIAGFYSGRPPEGYESTVELYRQLDPNGEAYGEPLLSYAAQHGDAEGVAYLLGAGADATVRTDRGYTPLHRLAYEAGRKNVTQEAAKRVTELLLAAGTSPLRKDSDNRTCAFVAAERGMYGMLEALVAAGKRIDLTNASGDTPLHATVGYAKHADNSFFQYTKPQYEKLLAQPVPENVMERKIHDKRRETQQGQYDRDKAAVDNYFRTVQVLLEGGLDPDQKNNHGRTAKEAAFECQDIRIAALLGGTYTGENDAGDRLQMRTKGMNVHQAVLRKDHDALAALLELGADPNEFCGEEGAVDDVNMVGRCPLALACQVLDAGSVELLVHHGADPNRKDEAGRIPAAFLFSVEASVRISHRIFKEKVLETVLAAMMQGGLQLDGAADDHGNTLLNLASRALDSGSSYNGKTLPERVATLLLGAGADVNAANYDGLTPLMCVCRGRSSRMEDFQLTLLEQGADVAARDKQGNTPLMGACQSVNHAMAKEMADMLFQFGDPAVDAVNNEGKTALELAAEQNNELLVNFLLTKL